MRINLDALNRALKSRNVSFDQMIKYCSVPPMTALYIKNGFPVSFTQILQLSNYLKIQPARLC